MTDSASPIDIISGADISAQPTANMLDTVRNLVPSFYVGQNSISDASTFVRAPSLRGLPSDEVLVLLNGKRYNRSALVQERLREMIQRGILLIRPGGSAVGQVHGLAVLALGDLQFGHPTRITATPPTSFARRSCSFSRS